MNHPRVLMLVGILAVMLLIGCSGGGAANGGVPPVTGAYEQAKLSSEHSSLALTAATGGDLNGARQHAEHVINLIVGEGSGDQFGVAYGDHDGNGTAENPGDGVGVWPYTNEAITQLDASIESPDTPADVKTALSNARQCLVNLREQTKTALTQAQAVIAGADAPTAATSAQTMSENAQVGTFGTDADGNGAIDSIANECGAEQAYNIVSLNVPDLLAP